MNHYNTIQVLSESRTGLKRGLTHCDVSILLNRCCSDAQFLLQTEIRQKTDSAVSIQRCFKGVSLRKCVGSVNAHAFQPKTLKEFSVHVNSYFKDNKYYRKQYRFRPPCEPWMSHFLKNHFLLLSLFKRLFHCFFAKRFIEAFSLSFPVIQIHMFMKQKLQPL